MGPDGQELKIGSDGRAISPTGETLPINEKGHPDPIPSNNGKKDDDNAKGDDALDKKAKGDALDPADKDFDLLK